MAQQSDDRRGSIAVIISTGADGLSDPVQLHGYRVTALAMSTGWDAAAVTFQAGLSSGGTFADVHGSTGNELTLTVDAAQVVALGPVLSEQASALPWLKVRSGTSALAVAQSTDRVLVLGLWLA